jgi:hypothetical protein
LKPEQFKLGNPTPGGPASPPAGAGYLALLDRYNKPILYYRAIGKPNIRLTRSYVAYRGDDKPLYNAADNWNPVNSTGAMNKETLSRMLGDVNADGDIDAASTAAAETPAHEGPYLLWSAGPDETFGPPAGLPVSNPELTRRAVQRSDDITNFRN